MKTPVLLALAAALVAPSALAYEPLPRKAPADAGVDAAALKALLGRAKASRTDALVVVKDGAIVAEYYNKDKDPGPIETMSVTKSIVGLAVLHAVHTGALKSLDQKVHTLYPEWKQGRKASITVRHLMSHTSGLQADGTRDIHGAEDFVQLALAAELEDDPGARFRYNNKATNLLAGIIHKATGQPLDVYVADHLLSPLGVTEHRWRKDPAGTPRGMAGLALRAEDLARIGLLVLQGGTWQGKEIIPERLIDAALAQGQPHYEGHGLLWWRDVAWTRLALTEAVLTEWERAGVPQPFRKRLRPLRGKVLSQKEYYKEAARLLEVDDVRPIFKDNVWKHGARSGERTTGPVVAYRADGWLGQIIYIYPERGLVGVRQLAWTSEYGDDPSKADGMGDFGALLRALVK